MTPERRQRRRFLVCGVGTAVLAAAAPAKAQSDFFSRSLDRLGRSLEGDEGGAGVLSSAEIGEGLKQALKIGAERVVDQLGRSGGYLNDAAIRIPLPGFLGQAQGLLRSAGAAGLLDDLEVRLNRAAESAAPHARDIFLDAIGEMTLADARTVLNGPDDAATRYFQRTMTPDLKAAFRPVVERELDEAGAIRAFDSVSARYADIPFVPDLGSRPREQLVDHAVGGAIDGIFHYLAEEEAAIRNDPARRTTDLLKTVFG